MSKPKIRKREGKRDPERKTKQYYVRCGNGKLNGGVLVQNGDTSSPIKLSSWESEHRYIHVLVPFSTCKIKVEGHLPATGSDGWHEIEDHTYDIEKSDTLYSYEFKPELYRIRLRFTQLSADQIAPFVFLTSRK